MGMIFDRTSVFLLLSVFFLWFSLQAILAVARPRKQINDKYLCLFIYNMNLFYLIFSNCKRRIENCMHVDKTDCR